MFAACTAGNDRSAADYPEWEYKLLKKELMKGWNSGDTRNVFNQVYFPDLTGIQIALVDAEGQLNDQMRVGNRDDVENSDKFYHWGALLGYINLLED